MPAVASGAREESISKREGTRLACLLAAGLGIAFTVACFFPGYMSRDSVSQLWQARTMSFTDWHPPVMSLLWGLLDRVIPGPASMLILHSLMFWSGMGLFVYHLGYERASASIAILLIGLAPPVFALLSTIWKDVGMGCSLVLACGLLLRADRRHSKTAWALAIVFLWYGLAVRHNGIIAVVPLAIWAALVSGPLWPGRNSDSRLSAALRACSLVVLLLLAAQGANRSLTKPGSPPPVQQILVHDLVGVSLETDRLDLPDYLVDALGSREVSALRPLYSPNEVVPLFCCDTKIRRLPLVAEPDKLSRLWSKWRSTIPCYLGAYFRHRTRVFESEMGIGRAMVCAPYWNRIEENPWGLEFHATPLNRQVMSILSGVSNSLLFRGWFWVTLIGAVTIAFLLGSSPGRSSGVLIGLSGLLYVAVNFFVGTTCDFRMHWWTVLATFLVALLLIAGWLDRVRARASL